MNEQQFTGDPCILAGDDIGAGQQVQCPQGYVTGIANWRGDHIQARREGGLKGFRRGFTARRARTRLGAVAGH